jgi:hypothetical protein
MGKRANLGKTLSGAQRDFQMVRRIVILIHILLIGGVPMSLFIFLSFENLAPKYHMRIGFICVQVSLPSVMIALFQFTDLLKKSIRKIICGQSSVVNPTLMTHPTIFFENKTFENRIRESIQFQNVEIIKYRRIRILK